MSKQPEAEQDLLLVEPGRQGWCGPNGGLWVAHTGADTWTWDRHGRYYIRKKGWQILEEKHGKRMPRFIIN